MTKTCVIWSVDTQTLQKYLDTSKTLKQVIVERLGMNVLVPQGIHYKRLKRRISEDNLDTTKFEENRKSYMGDASRIQNMRIKRKDSDCFRENSTCDRSSVKKRIRQGKLVPYECALCKSGPMWNDKELSLELDHINQINNDNRIENLRFLCPNCHSQVTNIHRKNNRKPTRNL